MISVVICTYNRSDFLSKAIESLVTQDYDQTFEIIVVDNNSNDLTPQVVERWCERTSIPIHYMLEKRQGLSHARNSGANAAAGQIIAFLDDDARADQRWLANIQMTLTDQPDIVALGGASKPDWEIQSPSWVADELLSAFGISSYGDKPFVMKGKLYPLGGNCAVRREVFERGIYFRPELGRNGSSLLACEELEFFHTVRHRGGDLLYAPNVVIHHYIPAHRITQEYVREWRYWEGRSVAIWDRLRVGLLAQALWFAPLRLMLTLWRDAPVWAWACLSGNTDLSFRMRCRIAKTRGYLTQARMDLAQIPMKFLSC